MGKKKTFLEVDPLAQEDVPGGACMVAETSFATLFPGYLEKYVTEVWPTAEQVLKDHQLKGKLDLVEGSMSVSTTRKTWDPYAIVKARDFVKLLARNVPIAQAQKIFDDNVTCDIIKIGMAAKNAKRFVKRRDRLIGPEGQSLKALEILSGCYVLVQGKTVAVMGPPRGCIEVRKIVEDSMKNIHPVYGLKRLLIRKELGNRPDLANEDWSRFMPEYKKTKVNKEKSRAVAKRKKARVADTKAKAAKKERTIFPPAPMKRKEDIAMETGEAFMGADATYRARRYVKKGKAQEGGDYEA